PLPATILDEHASTYTITFQPNSSGIIPLSPRLIAKHHIETTYPDVITTWTTYKQREREEALKIHRNMTGYAYFFCTDEPGLRDRDPGVACDQGLLRGMGRHWGDLRRCERHVCRRGGAAFMVCKGCRVAHRAQVDCGFERDLVMVKGARVRVCGRCADEAVKEFGVGYRGCGCDAVWSCYRCREEELGELAKARREGYAEGVCGMCAGGE
ncbi:hypothetical protein BDW02DRAFT_475130, partial [Decorospora gaudefroyi]